MKTLIKTFLLICISFNVKLFAQTAPEIEWQNTIGGGKDDYCTDMKPTSDGGYIIGGYSSSGISPDKSEPSFLNTFGSSTTDYWIVKLNATGNIVWENTIGGSTTEVLSGVEQTNDGGFILGGTSNSDISSDKTENSKGDSDDYWVVKLSSSGEIEWQNTIGGTKTDVLKSVQKTYDGGYIIGGYSNSNTNFDKSADNLGGYDYWVLKLDSLGNIEWDKTIGANNDDYLYSLRQTSDHGYILGGYSRSHATGDKTEDQIGHNDYWVIKLNEYGSIVWQNVIGGKDNDYLYSIIQTADGGYLAGGTSESPDNGDKTEDVSGINDYWVVKLDTLGNIVWQNTIGGNGYEGLYNVCQLSSGEYLLGGTSSSNISGDKNEISRGANDFWVVNLDEYGNIIWQKTIGGGSNDVIYSITEIEENKYILGGISYSALSGEKTEENKGYNDYWVIKLGEFACVNDMYYEDADTDGFGNFSSSIDTCVLLSGYTSNSTDCDDTNAAINPAGDEVCNDLDDDCNGFSDEGFDYQLFYADTDDDSFGNIYNDTISCLLFLEGYVSNFLDCNDSYDFVNPTGTEVCNLLDDNCNGETDEDIDVYLFFTDADGDGFGDPEKDTLCCLAVFPGHVFNNDDCDDANEYVYPGAIETTDGIDNNCNELIDEGIVSVPDIEKIITLNVFPNPASDHFTIEIQSTEIQSADIKISITNMLGEEIFSETAKLISGELNKTIQLTETLVSGIYTVKIISGKHTLSEQLIIV